MSPTIEIVVASRNRKKAAELGRFLARLPVRTLDADEAGGNVQVEEDGETFAANAAKKAAAFARACGRWALGDDSGLCVDALGGAPGVRSARFAGEKANDFANNRKLLAELAGIPAERRTARFVCSLALADPTGTIRLAVEGSAEGRVLAAPRGVGGFGYDPLFLYAPLGRTFAELPPEEKDRVSHRGVALRALAAGLVPLLGSGGAPPG
ncbi:MAG TPA: RdgB/HAM1 family non-canonical purine NTP pyrophosphatase [Planctomycetota bacterium]|jgi:XTP/dITP diphosphohydrolase|nr:RdgB/HAM1 family non-canonical purine NTP pyrophosphatase [Planctomycetota bacterium]